MLLSHIKFTNNSFVLSNFLQPASYVSHLIGHEGKGSLLSSLKKLGFATGLSCYPNGNYDGFWFFEISCSLTESGIGEFCLKIVRTCQEVCFTIIKNYDFKK